MCGRYSFAVDDALIWERFGVRVQTAIYKASYNCAPSQRLAILSGQEPLTLNYFRWGLIPSWARDAAIGNKMINARSETILEKPAFNQAFLKRRCLVPADSFYEWTKNPGKTPYRILLKNSPCFSMAGIWEQWKNNDGEVIRSFAILTTQANRLIAPLHDRMPVILHREEERFWLTPLPETGLIAMLKPFPPELMEAYPISNIVNAPKNNSPEIHAPLTTTLF